jgi:hypothetical protein
MAHSNENPTPAPEQLALLSPGDLPLQFRLDQGTRLRGLAHIAAIKAQLAAKAASRQPEAARPARRAA